MDGGRRRNDVGIWSRRPFWVSTKTRLTSEAVRVIPCSRMPGRLTGNARHLTDPAGKIYFATMEEGLYSVDVKTLDVEEHIQDVQS